MRTEVGPLVGDDEITFRLDDPDERFTRVRLYQEVVRPRLGLEFYRTNLSDRWELRFPKPDADRIEYKIELTHPDGSTELVCDPNNPLRTPGPFGDKSVIELPGYRAPRWLDEAAPAGNLVETHIESAVLKDSLRAMIWSSPGVEPGERVPLLVAHDGPDYAHYSALTRFLEVFTALDELPPMRAALIAPIDRDEIYSASAAYARTLAHEILPRLGELAPTPEGRNMRVGMGASLGALAMLHTHRTYPASFGALLLQSGSFFRQRFDKQEARFRRFRRINRFMGRVLSDREWTHAIPIAMTCGTIEENLLNNRATHEALAAQGYDVWLIENRDGHNWTGWRDVFDPLLLALLKRVWT